MTLLDSNEAQIAVLLSAERLTALNHLTGSQSTAIALHQETLNLGASLMNVTATIEIALRNSVYENLSNHFNVRDWLHQKTKVVPLEKSERDKVAGALVSARRAKYSKMTQAEKIILDQSAYPAGRPANTSHSRRVRARQLHIPLTDGSVIPELTLNFWKRLFGSDYDQFLWRTTLKRVFPNKKISRATVAKNLEVIYQSRNRLAHHEPVLHKRYDDTMESIQFIAENLGIPNSRPDSALAQLIIEDVAEVSSKAVALHFRLQSFKT